MFRITRRVYSKAKKLPDIVWAKVSNASQAFQVPTANCLNVADLSEKVKLKLSPELDSFSASRITIQESPDEIPLRPGLKLIDIGKLDQNSDENPLIVI